MKPNPSRNLSKGRMINLIIVGNVKKYTGHKKRIFNKAKSGNKEVARNTMYQLMNITK